MNLGELFSAAIRNKRGSQYSEDDLRKFQEWDRKFGHHSQFRPGTVVQHSDRTYVVGQNGNFVRQ